MALGTWQPCLGLLNSGFPITFISGSSHGNFIATIIRKYSSGGVSWKLLVMSGSSRKKNLLEADSAEEEWDQLVDLVPRCTSSAQHHAFGPVAEGGSRGRSQPHTGPKTDPASSPEIASRWSPGLCFSTCRILRNRNDRLHPNPKTNFSLSIYTTLVLIPVCCQRQFF